MSSTSGVCMWRAGVGDMALKTTPRGGYDAERHPILIGIYGARTMENPRATAFEPHPASKRDTGAASQNSFAVAARTEVGQMESHSREAKDTGTNATFQSWDANAPPSPREEKTHTAPCAKAGPSGNTQRQENLALCDSRDLSPGRAKKAKLDFGGPQPAESHGIHDNAHQRLRETSELGPCEPFRRRLRRNAHPPPVAR